MKGVLFALPIFVAAMANAREAELPVPPIPPAEPPPLAAPIPDPTFVGQYHSPGHVTVTLFSGINHRADPETGFGYAPGSQYQLDNDRRFMLPGVIVRVPLP